MVPNPGVDMKIWASNVFSSEPRLRQLAKSGCTQTGGRRHGHVPSLSKGEFLLDVSTDCNQKARRGSSRGRVWFQQHKPTRGLALRLRLRSPWRGSETAR